LSDKLSAGIGRHVVLGIRPEHFHTHPVGGEGDCCAIPMRLNVVEPLGNDMDIYMTTASELHDHVVGRVEAQPGLEMNSQIPLYADLRKVHFFEPGVTGMNLSLVQESAHAVA
jgi:ABC-type sugar transport system ATPase subunit